MKKNYEYFEDHTDYQELERQKKEMDQLIQLGKKNKEAYMSMLDDLNNELDRLVAIKERY